MITERQTNITLTERGIYKHLFEYYFDILPIGSNLVRIETPSLERANMDIHSLIEMGVRQKDFTVGTYSSGFTKQSGEERLSSKGSSLSFITPPIDTMQSGDSRPTRKEEIMTPRYPQIDLVYINSPLSTIITDCREWLPKVRYAGFAIIDNLKSTNHLVVEYMHLRNNGIKMPEWQLANNINGTLGVWRRL